MSSEICAQGFTGKQQLTMHFFFQGSPVREQAQSRLTVGFSQAQALLAAFLEKEEDKAVGDVCEGVGVIRSGGSNGEWGQRTFPRLGRLLGAAEEKWS